MRLHEFIDKNGNKVTIPKNTPSAPSVNTSLGSFKERFEKLLKYTSKHKNPKTTKITTEKLTEDTLEFTEHYDDGSTVSYEIYIGPLTEAWSFKVYTDGDFRHPIDHMSGMEWSELLKQLRYYIVIPTTGTPEYKDILLEFVDKNGNQVKLHRASSAPNVSKTSSNSSKTNKEKFEELISYMDTHKDSYTTKTKTLKLDDTGFLYQLTRKSPGIKEYTLDFEVEYDETNSSWRFQVDKNSMYLDSDSGKYWEYLLAALKKCAAGYCFDVPTPGSKEYDSICESVTLQEFVDKNGNKIVLPKTSSSAPAANKTSPKTPSDKFKELTDYMKAHVSNEVEKAEVVELDNGGFTYRETRKKFTGLEYVLSITVNWSQFTSNWKYELHMDSRLLEEQYGKGLKELIKHMFAYFNTPRPGSQEYRDILTEATSIADDFREYENLWD